MTYLALAVIGIGAFLLLCKLLWSSQLPSKNTRIIMIASLILVVVLGTLVLLARIPWVVAAFIMLLPYLRVLFWLALPFLWRAVQQQLMFLFFQNVSGGGQSTFHAGATAAPEADSETQTSELAMKLNHQTGTMTGRVLFGEFQGTELDSLKDDEVLSVYRSLQTEESKRLLEAYVDRHRPHLNNTARDKNTQYGGEKMSVRRAADVLGIDDRASKDEIISAHRRLMDKLHPDKGGSSYLAAELNKAKEVLLEAHR